MSANPTPSPRPLRGPSGTGPLPGPSGAQQANRRSLTPVAAPTPKRIARAPFLALLVGFLGFGMTGLLVLNTTLQSQTFALGQMKSELRDLAATEAGLQATLDEQNSTRTLTRRASDIGMRPRDHTAFVSLPDGKIVGELVPSGHDYPASFLDRDPETVRAEEQDEASGQADRRIEAEERSRAERREEVRQAQVEAAREQARRDGANGAEGDETNEEAGR